MHPSRSRPLLASAVTFWMASILFSGLFAAVAFPGVKELAPVAPSMTILQDQHWRLIAGHVAQRVFTICCGLELALFLASLLLARLAGGASPLRWLLLVAAGSLRLYVTLMLVLPMNRLAAQILDAARAGDSAQATALQARFDPMHAQATPLMSVMLLCLALFMALSLAAWKPSAEAETTR